jgi:hypothetical protein
MRAVAIFLALTGCVYFDSDESGDGPVKPPIEDDDGDGLPAGVWEPVPAGWIYEASVAADGDTLWWATGRHIASDNEYGYEEGIWLHATSPSGEQRSASTQVAPGLRAGYDPIVVVTPSAIIAHATNNVASMLGRFARNAEPMGEPYEIVIESNGTRYGGYDRDLVATADGRAQFVATLGTEMSEAAIVDLDLDGNPVTTTLVGTRDTNEPGGSGSYGIAAAARPDGSTFVGWGRHYQGCISDKPAQTWTTTVNGGTVAPVVQAHDSEGSEFNAAVASRGDGAYIAWQTEGGLETGAHIELARASDVTTIIGAVDGVAGFTSRHTIALSTPDRGAIAFIHTDDTVHVVPFADRSGTLLLGEPSIVKPVGTRGPSTVVGLVHVGGDHFVVAWIEVGMYYVDRDPDHLYATELDFAGAALRPAPPLTPVTAKPARSRLRCP